VSTASRGEKHARKKDARKERNAKKEQRLSKKVSVHGDSRVGRGKDGRPGRG
jgi:hypothetical protein